jgi:hypothetical protein
MNYTSYFEKALAAGRQRIDAALIDQVLHELALSAIKHTDYI